MRSRAPPSVGRCIGTRPVSFSGTNPHRALHIRFQIIRRYAITQDVTNSPLPNGAKGTVANALDQVIPIYFTRRERRLSHGRTTHTIYFRSNHQIMAE